MADNPFNSQVVIYRAGLEKTGFKRFLGFRQGWSGAGTRWNAVPANILEPERRSGKYCWPQVER